MNNKYTIAAITIIEIVIAITLITYSNFNISDAFGDHGEGFEDTYENWYGDRDGSNNYYQHNNHNKNKKNNQKDFLKNLIKNYNINTNKK